MSKILKFDLSTVFEHHILEPIARHCGWSEDEEKNKFEYWIQWATKNDVVVKLEIEKNTNFNSNNQLCSIKGVSYNTINTNEFVLPLSMCKQEFINQILKLCGYNEDRYNSDSLMKYLIDCQMQSKGDEYMRIYLNIPDFFDLDEKLSS